MAATLRQHLRSTQSAGGSSSKPSLASHCTVAQYNMDSVGSFEAVMGAFSQQVAELREATLLRVDGEGSGACVRQYISSVTIPLTAAMAMPLADGDSSAAPHPFPPPQTIRAACTIRMWRP